VAENAHSHTMPSNPTMQAVFALPFAEQVAFFRAKMGNLIPTATWRDIERVAHDHAFMVAGAAKADLLADLAGAVDKAIADGEGLDAFRKRFDAIVQKHGWQGWTGSESEAGRNWRTRVIYRTNLSTSYAAGRRVQLSAFPLWIYKHSHAEHPRLQHKAWDGLTLPAEHAFWATHYPPNGWGCGCRVVGARDAAGAARLGGNPAFAAPPDGWDVRNAKGQLPGLDEGWDYAPGASVRCRDAHAASAGRHCVDGDDFRTLEAKAARLPHRLGSDLLQAFAQRMFLAWAASPVGAFPLVRLPDEDARTLGAADGVRVGRLSPVTYAKQQHEHGELSAVDYGRTQDVINHYTRKKVVDNKNAQGHATGTQSMVYVRTERLDMRGGYVLVVKATKTGDGLFVTSFRKLSRDEALRDEAIRQALRE